MRRREFITFLAGAAAAGPLAAHGERGTLPTIGFIRDSPAKGSEYLVAALRRGLTEVGFVDGQNVAIDVGTSEGRRERLAEIAAESASRPVSVIVASATSATAAATAVTSTVPIVFAFPGDPVQLGFVKSMNRPGGNVTGVSYLNTELTGKRIGILRELFPSLPMLAVLINPKGANAAETVGEVNEDTRRLGMLSHFARATTAPEIDRAFDELRSLNARALLVGNDAFFTTQRVRIVENAMRIGIPAVYAQREFAEAGGLMAYGANLPEAYRLAGIYAGRVLKGERPADLPVIQPTKFEFIVNLNTAKALGIEMPDRVLAIADEVIE